MIPNASLETKIKSVRNPEIRNYAQAENVSLYLLLAYLPGAKRDGWFRRRLYSHSLYADEISCTSHTPPRKTFLIRKRPCC
jgi:hypothetical protein